MQKYKTKRKQQQQSKKVIGCSNGVVFQSQHRPRTKTSKRSASSTDLHSIKTVMQLLIEMTDFEEKFQHYS